MTHDDWWSGFRGVAVFLNGQAILAPSLRGERVVDDSFLMCFNAQSRSVDFVTPAGEYAQQWTARFDTFDPGAPRISFVAAGDKVWLPPDPFLCFAKPDSGHGFSRVCRLSAPTAWRLRRRPVHLPRTPGTPRLPRCTRRQPPVSSPSSGVPGSSRLRRHRPHLCIGGTRRGGRPPPTVRCT